MKNSHLPVAALLSLLFGCNKKEAIPAYLNIQSIDAQGITDEKITDAWVYADQVLLGAFPLPAEIPVLATGDVKITVFSGIRENGDYQTPNIYPLFTSFEIEAPLSAGKATAIQPVVKYEPASTLAFFDGFEPGSTNFFQQEVDADPLTRIVTTTDGLFEGAASGRIAIDTAHQVFEAYSLQIENLPVTNRPCWLEISYKTDFPFSVGIAGADKPTDADAVAYFQTIFPKAEWTKMYINLSEALALSGYPFNKIALRARLPLDDNLKPKIISGNLFLDNVRLVYLK